MASHTVKDMGRYAPLVAAVIVVLAAGEARADLASGRDKLTHGDYAGAKRELSEVRGAERAEARTLLVRAHLTTGDHEAAEKVARALAKNARVSKEGRTLLAEVLQLTGRYDEARRELEPVVAAFPDFMPARHRLGLIYLDVGRTKLAAQQFKYFIDQYDASALDLDDARQLYFLAEASRFLEEFQLANDAYNEAVQLDGTFHLANLRWGDLFMQKYAAGDAEQSYDDVLRTDPHNPDAHNGMALVKLEQSYDVAAARRHIDEALETNPQHMPSLITRAMLEIDGNDWDDAKKTLEQVFAVNELNFEARALLATIHWLRDDTKAYAAEEKRVFRANPAYADFYHVVARSAVREHRYDAAIELEREALRVRPDYYEAMQALGSGYLRLGKEKEGIDWLTKAWEGDQYNVRTKNLLDLYEDTIDKHYAFVASKTFKLRYHKDEQRLLRRYLEPLLEEAYADMVARYRFTPKKPLIIEIFQDSNDYSIRTVGLPNLGALGVCFGHVITAISPSNGNINWGMVLWHELGHVFALQISDGRVPRWYTEGLSEYETIIRRPEWRRENDTDLYGALVEGTLPSVADLNEHFLKPSPQAVVVAYYLSSVVIEYIARTHGFDKLVEGLHHFGSGLETPEVIEKITGQSVPEFDEAFRAYLEQRLAPYEGSFHLPLEGYSDITKLEIARDAAPDTAKVHADLALGHFYAGDARKAAASADKALDIEPDNTIALYIKAEIAFRRRDADGAKELYEKMITLGADGFDIRGRLAMIAKSQGDNDAAVKQLSAAKKLDPERSYPYMELYEIYKKEGKDAEALAELETYVMLEQMQYAHVRDLVAAYADKGRWHKVRHYGEIATQIFPFDAELHLHVGRAYLETGDADKALFTYDSALLARPELRRPALAHIGRAKAYLAKDDKRRAKAALRKALKTEPANAEALELKKKVGLR